MADKLIDKLMGEKVIEEISEEDRKFDQIEQ